MIHVRIQGPWPFITRRSYTLAGRHLVWLSRPHRKGLVPATEKAALQPLWQTKAFNWSIGALFALGAFLFILGSVFSLLPSAIWDIPGGVINGVFFLGSIPFTTAAFMQLVQAANSSGFMADRVEAGAPRFALIGWYPRNAGWLSSLTQFLGTLAFNADTLNAVLDPSRWYVKDASIWIPNMVGSILFLVSGYLAFIEVGHRYWRWRPRDLSWQIVFVNLLGCVAFMVAALLGYYPPSSEQAWIGIASTANTLAGGACFFVGALLTCRESGTAEPQMQTPRDAAL